MHRKTRFMHRKTHCIEKERTVQVLWVLRIGVAMGGTGSCPPKCSAYTAIWCFEKRRPKQKILLLSKISIFPSPEILGWLRHWCCVYLLLFVQNVVNPQHLVFGVVSFLCGTFFTFLPFILFKYLDLANMSSLPLHHLSKYCVETKRDFQT